MNHDDNLKFKRFLRQQYTSNYFLLIRFMSQNTPLCVNFNLFFFGSNTGNICLGEIGRSCSNGKHSSFESLREQKGGSSGLGIGKKKERL